MKRKPASLPRKHKSERKKLVDDLDRIFSVYIRNRDSRCVICGSNENLTNGHLFSRTAYSTRWDEENCHAQCWGCNLKHEYDFYPFDSYVRELLGSTAYEELHRRYSTPKIFKNFDLIELIEKYRVLTISREQNILEA